MGKGERELEKALESNYTTLLKHPQIVKHNMGLHLRGSFCTQSATLTDFDRHNISVDPDRKAEEALARNNPDPLYELKGDLLTVVSLQKKPPQVNRHIAT